MKSKKNIMLLPLFAWLFVGQLTPLAAETGDQLPPGTEILKINIWGIPHTGFYLSLLPVVAFIGSSVFLLLLTLACKRCH